MRLMNVGATDEEVVRIYRHWCAKHGLRAKIRFVTHVMPAARRGTAAYIADWNARLPKRRKQGTTRQQIFEAIRSGATQPKQIARGTQLKGSSVRMQLKRLTNAGHLVRASQGYAIASDYSPVDASIDREVAKDHGE